MGWGIVPLAKGLGLLDSRPGLSPFDGADRTTRRHFREATDLKTARISDNG